MGRLENQCRKMLTLLKERGNQGATNAELAKIALKYTSRISDLRDLGHDIRCQQEGADGLYRYHYFGRIRKGQSRLFGGQDVTDNNEGMDKYAVEEDGSGVKTADAQGGVCPKCGAKLESTDKTNVLKCPNCGTLPFEDAR
jgi:hypothetical protein